MAADTPMTNAERACCQMMKNECGQKDMPASHDCCHKILGSIYDNALNTKAVALHPVAITTAWMTASELMNPTSSATGWIGHIDYSPPKPPASTISILRI
jgi:hypothetical protein